MSMVQVLPIACDGKLVGSASVVALKDQAVYLATASHILGSAQNIQLAIPPHGGNCTLQQKYPSSEIAALEAEISAVDPFVDLAILRVKVEGISGFQTPRFVNRPNQLPVGSEVVVLGYPFAPLNSVLETWVPGFVSALAKRTIAEDAVEVDELVLTNVAHPGSSGSAVVGKADGVLYGILRGSLAPPEVMKIGEVPLATDTSVTFATSSHYLELAPIGE